MKLVENRAALLEAEFRETHSLPATTALIEARLERLRLAAGQAIKLADVFGPERVRWIYRDLAREMAELNRKL